MGSLIRRPAEDSGYFFMILPGVIAIALFSDLDISSINYYAAGEDGASVLCTNLNDCPNMTYPVMLVQLLPTGILGLVIAGLLAAMSIQYLRYLEFSLYVDYDGLCYKAQSGSYQ